MKKLLLFLSVLVLTSGVSIAVPTVYDSFSSAPLFEKFESGNNYESSPNNESSEKIVLSNAGDVAKAYRFNNMPNTCFVYMATEFTPEQMAPYAGCTISAVNVTAGCTYDNDNTPTTFPVERVKVFATETLDGIPQFITEGKINTDAFAVTSIGLENPLTISGDKHVYVGYMFEYDTHSFFIPTDNVNTPVGVNNTLVALTLREKEVPHYANYSEWGMGSLCISADITGDNLPCNLAKLTSMSLDSYFGNGKIFYTVGVKNNGANDVKSVTIRTEISNGTVYDRTFKLQEPLGPGQTSAVEILNVPNEKQGIFNLTAVLTKVNGYESSITSLQTGIYSSFDNGYPRFPVIEEYTSTWCQWGPRGIVMMEFLKERYPNWIRISAHVDDSMTVSSASNLIKHFDLTENVPFSFINRLVQGDVLGAAEDYYTPIYDNFTMNPAYANIDFTAECNKDGTSVDISSATEFSFDTDVKHLISFAIIEDQVGPYIQTNAYAGGTSGPMGGWESKPGKVETLYNDVLRELSDYPGNRDAIPDNIQKDTAYEYNLSMPLSNVKSDKFRIIGIVTNANTGEIVNAREHVWYKDNGAGIYDVNDSFGIAVKAESGNISTEDAKYVEVFTTDGRRVGTSGLAPGIYIVIADGRSFRILMK